MPFLCNCWVFLEVEESKKVKALCSRETGALGLASTVDASFFNSVLTPPEAYDLTNEGYLNPKGMPFGGFYVLKKLHNASFWGPGEISS